MTSILAFDELSKLVGLVDGGDGDFGVIMKSLSRLED